MNNNGIETYDFKRELTRRVENLRNEANKQFKILFHELYITLVHYHIALMDGIAQTINIERVKLHSSIQIIDEMTYQYPFSISEYVCSARSIIDQYHKYFNQYNDSIDSLENMSGSGHFYRKMTEDDFDKHEKDLCELIVIVSNSME